MKDSKCSSTRNVPPRSSPLYNIFVIIYLPEAFLHFAIMYMCVQIDKQILVKTEAMQELYATLEDKQMQVMRLEQVVKLLENQQDRAQAQRTRLEYRIAQLEVRLQEKNKDGNRYVTNKYDLIRSPRSSSVGDKRRLSRALSCESSSQALLETPTYRLVDSRLRGRSGFSTRYRYRRVLPAKSADLRPRISGSRRDKSVKFYPNNWTRVSSDKEEAFICEQCRRESKEKFRIDDAICRRKRDRRDLARKSLYGWLVGSSPPPAFGKFASDLKNTLNITLEDNANYVFTIRYDDEQDRRRESRQYRREQ